LEVNLGNEDVLIPGPVAGILVRLVTAGPGISLLLLGTADNHSGKRLVLATSNKPQASSLTVGPGDDRMDTERKNYD